MATVLAAPVRGVDRGPWAAGASRRGTEEFFRAMGAKEGLMGLVFATNDDVEGASDAVRDIGGGALGRAMSSDDLALVASRN